MGITVSGFVNEYKANKKNLMIFMKSHMKTDYISFLQKDAVCKGLVKATSYVKEEDGKREFIRFDSVTKYLLFTMKLVDLYTDIDIDGNQIAAEYDELFKVGAIEAIMERIPETEFNEFTSILKMNEKDLIDNEYSVTALLYNFKKSISLSEEIINSGLEALIKTSEDKNKE